MGFKTTHDLSFEVAEWEHGKLLGNGFYRFRVGTCEGIWKAGENSYDILAIENKSKGNGHFEDVLELFERSCKRDNKKLRVLEVWNPDFKKHLIEKRGFQDIGGGNIEKVF